MKKIILGSVLFFALPFVASASVNITGMTVNGGATANVAPSAPVSVEVFVTTTSSDDWESTSADWITDGNPSTCFNTSDKTSSGSYSATFNFNAPSVDGVYDLSLGAHGSNSGDDDTCSTFADDTDLFADVLTVSTPVVVVPPVVVPPAPSTPKEVVAAPQGGRHPVWIQTEVEGYWYCPQPLRAESDPMGYCAGKYVTSADVGVSNEDSVRTLQLKLLGVLKELLTLLQGI